MKRKVSLLLCVALLLGCFTMFSCDEEPTVETCTVTFDSCGGSAVESITVTKGEKVTEPTAPTLSGYTRLKAGISETRNGALWVTL